jgi:hypothetical protein
MNALLAAFFLQGGVAYEFPQDPPAGQAWAYSRAQTVNPYGVFALGFETDPDRPFSAQLAFRHASSLRVRDHGDNSLELTLKWKPFR